MAAGGAGWPLSTRDPGREPGEETEKEEEQKKSERTKTGERRQKKKCEREKRKAKGAARTVAWPEPKRDYQKTPGQQLDGTKDIIRGYQQANFQMGLAAGTGPGTGPCSPEAPKENQNCA